MDKSTYQMFLLTMILIVAINTFEIEYMTNLLLILALALILLVTNILPEDTKKK